MTQSQRDWASVAGAKSNARVSLSTARTRFKVRILESSKLMIIDLPSRPLTCSQPDRSTTASDSSPIGNAPEILPFRHLQAQVPLDSPHSL